MPGFLLALSLPDAPAPSWLPALAPAGLAIVAICFATVLGIVVTPFHCISTTRSVPGYLKLRFGEPSRALSAVTFGACVIALNVAFWQGRAMHRPGMVSTWCVVGVLLATFGVLILGAGVDESVAPPARSAVLAELHAAIRWGALPLALGGFYRLRCSPWREE